MGKKAQRKRDTKAVAKNAKVHDRHIRGVVDIVDIVAPRIRQAFFKDDDKELRRIEAEFPKFDFEEVIFDDQDGGNPTTFVRAAGKTNRRKSIVFFADHIATRARGFGAKEAQAISDTFVAADTAIWLSVKNNGWTEMEATAWLSEALDRLVQSLSDPLFESVAKTETLSQATPQYQAAFQHLIFRERSRRERILLGGPRGAAEPPNEHRNRQTL